MNFHPEATPPRWLLALEFTALYLVFPLLVYFNLIPLPKLILLSVITIYTVLAAHRQMVMGDKKQNAYVLPKINRWKNWLHPYPVTRYEIYRVLIRFVIIGIVILMYAKNTYPEHFMVMPFERTGLWLLIMALYPFMSALPQEWLFRNFLFLRYKPLISSEKVMALVSIAVFGYLHIIYDNATAVAMTFGGGVLFTYTYLRTRSLWVVSLEHALYGMLIFTSGLGQYFYEGM